MTMPEPELLHIEVSFPHGIYSGATRESPEAFPSSARLHDALTAAAGGGPTATADGTVLVATDEHRAALEWLETHEIKAIAVPQQRFSHQRAKRFRRRSSPVTLTQTDFEPASCLAGPVTFLWQVPDSDQIIDSLREIASEVESVGRAESLAIVRVFTAARPDDGRALLEPAPGRGPGLVMPVPRPGRHATMVTRHRDLQRPGRHDRGKMGKQAPDEQPAYCDDALELRRFAEPITTSKWPFAEAWVCELDGNDAAITHALGRVTSHVPLAVAWHRAIVRDLADDVPSFVTGRDGDGPLRGAGHMALHFVEHGDGRMRGIVALPHDIDQADRARVWSALEDGVAVHWGRGARALRFAAWRPRQRSASAFWPGTAERLTTTVPLVLDNPGSPRKGPWSLEHAVIHTVGNAFRGTLESMGFRWGSGWQFRQDLVTYLRDEIGVEVHSVNRRRESASNFVHRAAPADLLIALDAELSLGKLGALQTTGLLAIGRARHLGGGLLVPQEGLA